jgi:hypothetical protein
MKKSFLLIAAFLLAAAISHAQTEKGNQTLGLDLGLQFNTTNNTYISPFDNSNTGQSSPRPGRST